VKISVIVACLNVEATIGRCLDSLAAQDYPNLEVVVADGGSRDGTIETVRRSAVAKSGRLVLFSEPDRGIGDAWNKAVARSSGDWLLFLGADDAFAAPDVLTRAATFLNNALPHHRILYGRLAMVGKSGEVLEYVDRPWQPKSFRSCDFCLPNSATFYHRSLFAEYGPFDETLRITSDHDFQLRALMRAEPMWIPDLTVARMQVGGLSSSRRNAPRFLVELMRLHMRHAHSFPFYLCWELLKCWVVLGAYEVGGDRLALSVSNLYRRLVSGRPPLRY